jgi:hypothetical protein
MHIIIGMPPHIIIMGMPAPIMFIMRWQHSSNISFDMPSLGITLHIMVLPDISQDIFIIGTGIGIIPPIMPDIMGIMPDIIGIMLFIIGIMPGIIPPIIGIIPGIIGIIGMLAGIAPIGICCMAVFIVGGSLLRCCRRPHSLIGICNGSEFIAPVLRSRSRARQPCICRSAHFAPIK